VSVVFGTTANVAGAAIRNFRIGPSLSNRIESGRPIRIRIESGSFACHDQKATYAACKPLFCNRREISSHVQATNRITSYLRSLDDIQVDVTLVLIPGHCDDIHYNDLVDRRAKDSVKVAIEIPS